MDRKLRNICFTAFDEKEKSILASVMDNASEDASEVAGNTSRHFLVQKATYIIYGIEICPETKKEHYQGYMEFDGQIRFGQLKKIFPKMHIEQRKGTQKQAIEYCKKDGKVYEYGEKKEQGKRNDLRDIAETVIKKGVQAVIEEHPEEFIKYTKGLKALQYESHVPEIKEKNIYILWGVSGSGKTHKVYEENNIQEIYRVKYGNSGIWFDGYDFRKHKAVLFDEFVGQVKIQDMLQYLDKYPVQVEFKGGVTWFQPEKIYICSNKHPKEWYDWSKQQKNIQQAFMRRIAGRLTEFTKQYIDVELEWDLI